MSFTTLAQRSPRAGNLNSFLVGCGQMLLMSINVRNMSNGHLFFLFTFTLLNTCVWAKIVRLVIHSTKWELGFYAAGSALGAVLGVLTHHFVIEPNALIHLAGLFLL